ncbi:Crp/Fnr family transcriptional regulator [Rhizobium sp. Root1220]|uniref:Crp/Fnr family transcriptional regulator n=1 Tax=Rhizobium sp. Root1220 TaxID=1736432 RepID=UPI0006F68444|nr:Crp/Fnr family transcriptional regulator [Rhizobium sp. Root1220]KQV83378.1 Crp/Fnr family transcriptional regulator [Rhizobium sp. Root1220]
MIEALLLNLESRDLVSQSEKQRLRDIIRVGRTFAPGEDLVEEGMRPSYSTLMVDGLSARYKQMADGSRQFTALQVPGDFVDLHALLLRKLDHGIVALSPCRVGFADHADLKKLTETMPHLTRLLWLNTIVDAAINREWIASMGRRSKTAHIAHLICELYVRLRTVDRVDGWSFQLPLTQAELADVVGISLVHANKTLQALRRQETFVWEARVLTITDWPRLCEIAGFDETYLSLVIEPR